MQNSRGELRARPWKYYTVGGMSDAGFRFAFSRIAYGFFCASPTFWTRPIKTTLAWRPSAAVLAAGPCGHPRVEGAMSTSVHPDQLTNQTRSRRKCPGRKWRHPMIFAVRCTCCARRTQSVSQSFICTCEIINKRANTCDPTIEECPSRSSMTWCLGLGGVRVPIGCHACQSWYCSRCVSGWGESTAVEGNV